MAETSQSQSAQLRKSGWVEPPRFVMAVRVLLTSLVLGGLWLLIFSLIEAPWRVPFSPIVQPWWYLVIGVASLVAALLAFACTPWLRKFFPFTQQLIFAALFAACTFVTMLLMMLITTLLSNAQRCLEPANCAEDLSGPLWGAVVWALYIYVLMLLLPSLLFGVTVFGVARWSLSGSTRSRLYWPACAIIVFGVVVFAALTVCKVFPEPNIVVAEVPGPVISGQTFSNGSEQLLDRATCTMIGEDGVEREIDCPLNSSGEQSGPTSPH